MGKNPDAFFADCTARFGPIFRVVTAGRKMTFITSSNVCIAYLSANAQLNLFRYSSSVRSIVIQRYTSLHPCYYAMAYAQ